MQVFKFKSCAFVNIWSLRKSWFELESKGFILGQIADAKLPTPRTPVPKLCNPTLRHQKWNSVAWRLTHGRFVRDNSPKNHRAIRRIEVGESKNVKVVWGAHVAISTHYIAPVLFSALYTTVVALKLKSPYPHSFLIISQIQSVVDVILW